MRPAEIAAALNLDDGTVRTRLNDDVPDMTDEAFEHGRARLRAAMTGRRAASDSDNPAFRVRFTSTGEQWIPADYRDDWRFKVGAEHVEFVKGTPEAAKGEGLSAPTPSAPRSDLCPGGPLPHPRGTSACVRGRRRRADPGPLRHRAQRGGRHRHLRRHRQHAHPPGVRSVTSRPTRPP